CIAARPRQAGNKTKPDRVFVDYENDGNAVAPPSSVMNSRRFTEQCLPCFPNERNSTLSAAALRDFRPFYVRSGSIATDAAEATRPCRSAWPPKADKQAGGSLSPLSAIRWGNRPISL